MLLPTHVYSSSFYVFCNLTAFGKDILAMKKHGLKLQVKQ